MKKRIIKFFKKDIVKFFIIDFAFFALLGGLFLVARDKITTYLLQWMAYAEQVSQLTQVVQEQGMDALAQVEALASVVEPLATKLYLALYLFVPLGIYLVWCLTQGFNYNLLGKKKLLDWKAYGRFLLFNFPFFVLLFLLVEFLFRQMTVTGSINLFMFGLVLLVIILLVYFMQVMYVFIHNYKFVKLMKHSSKLAVYKFHKLFPLTLVSVLIFFIAFIFLWNILIKVVASTSGYLLSIIFLLVSIFLWGVYRKFLVNFIKKA